MLLKVEYVTVTDYLQLFETISKALGNHTEIETLTYAAAAVSDF